ncbi:MAG: sigma 54-interacting transcriptional regulator [Clostridium sp.]
MLSVNCTTLPENLIESELFGYEIGDLPLQAQGKILELIEDKTFISVGGSKKKKTNIRIIAATNKDIEKMVSEGSFREDLYYRLNVMELNLIPLRKRKNEIPQLVERFVKNFNEKYSLKKEFSKESIERLERYDWPGNIRELKNIIEKIMISVKEESIEKFFKSIESEYPKEDLKIPKLKEYLDGFEKLLVLSAYNKYRNSYKVAEALGIPQSQASRRIRKYIEK